MENLYCSASPSNLTELPDVTHQPQNLSFPKLSFVGGGGGGGGEVMSSFLVSWFNPCRTAEGAAEQNATRSSPAIFMHNQA